MIHRLSRALMIAAIVSSAAPIFAPRPAEAYQIDCAILLCLAGDFPPSEPCARAKAEMIRRITPWPVEPPLQLWRCPMRAALPISEAAESQVIETVFKPVQPRRLDDEPGPGLDRLWRAFGEDVTDYVMAIKVYDLTYNRRRNRDGDCIELGRLRIGSYDHDWAFSWRRAPHNASPDWFFNTAHTSCSSTWFRGIGMEWRDHEGSQGTEVVRY